MSELINFIEQEMGALLRAAREDKGWTRKEAADRIGVSEQEIEQIESHSGKVTLAVLQKYAEAVDKKVQIKFL